MDRPRRESTPARSAARPDPGARTVWRTVSTSTSSSPPRCPLQSESGGAAADGAADPARAGGTGQSARALARAREDLRTDVAVDRDLLDERAEHGDDRGVVALAQAGRDAREEELAVERGGHQRRARRMTHFEHQVHVLQVLGELALRLEVALQHAQALDVHGPGIGAAVLE